MLLTSYLLSATIVLSFLFCGLPASSADSPEQAESSSRYSAPTVPAEMTPRAKELMQILELGPSWQKVSSLQDQVRATVGTEPTLESLLLRFKWLSSRQALVEELESAEFDVRAVAARIDTEIADADTTRATLTRKRDRDLALNLGANFATAGIAKIVGNSIGLTPGGEPTNHILEIVDGFVQTSLPLLYIKQQYGERKMVNSVPTILAAVITPSPEIIRRCPPSVWKFMNSVPQTVTNGETRIVWLTDKWRKMGLFERHRRVARTAESTKRHLAGTVPDHHSVTIALLEDRSAMLADLRAMVSQMDLGLHDLMKEIRASFPLVD